MNELDRRLHAFRPDLADARLKGKTDARRYETGRGGRVCVPVLDVKSAPRPDAGIDTQLLMGDAVTVFEEAEGFAWVQAERDSYVGYISSAGLDHHASSATHVVVAPRTFVYREPDMKKPSTACLSIGSLVDITGSATTRGTDYCLLDTGEAIVATHLQPVGEAASDFVSVTEMLEYTPYLWGGTSAFGIDCSGLVQLTMRIAGRDVLRDTDMQARSVGEVLDIGDELTGLARGDLVFWKGHVAIMLDSENVIHANGHTMMVSSEPLREAVDRIGYLYGLPTGFRRP
ncbi:NlpC/P60 family protein [Mesorhizobium sp. CAU 1741]|uniref:C40 family peptidase n=1 Tax=Mesorhizobium sp. CAU 1741 TaxID=3140366 RepID=UPI00325AFD33